MPNYIVILFGIYLYQAECFGVFVSYKSALGIVWEDRYRPLASGGFNLVIKLLLVLWLRRFGDEVALIGILIATILSYALVNCPWSTYFLFKKYFKTGLKDCYIATYTYFVIILFVSLASVPIFNLLPVCDGMSGYINIGIRLLLCIVLPNLLLIGIYWRTPVFSDAKSFVLSRIKS